jgi:lincosamide nucleotidyltransferase
LLTTNNLIKREEFAHAHQSLTTVQKYLLWLIRTVTNKTQHWESPTKSLEKDIDQDWYSEFILTTSDLNPKNINTAFQNSLKISEKLFDKLNVGLKLKEILKRIE